MRLVRDLNQLPANAQGCAVAIGNFDGLHAGHKAVISAMKEQALARGLSAAIMTFEPHPRMFFQPENNPLRIEPFHVKARRLKAAGIDILYMLRFNRTLSEMPARDFVEKILITQLQACHVTTGEGFVFGYQRGGNSALLAEMAQEKGFGYQTVPPVMQGGEPCSSTRIRAHLSKGEMTQVETLLGHAYEISGRVMKGDQRGRELGFPTANLLHANLFAPACGVYAVEYARVSSPDAPCSHLRWRPAVANYGIRPTFGGDRMPRLEVHALQGQPELYGKYLRVRLKTLIRPEQTFETIDALKAQITQDCEKARFLLKAAI